ncbi:RidA family protein [Roseomonas sp. CECT 9278]|uniref:RidA family protein n=1 Tax=Roseomonas sp. CECT 9278 TaxID=2845823 RepID=UPI001EF9C409|nr:RidA family protein [Roseomonas sp. CECT 9278]CAH0248739.1 2-iminobutanoate/2-iminopropanoate deaminase [Roseomonas sp. CECT 9278]
MIRLPTLAALALMLPLAATAQDRVVATRNAPEAIGPYSQAIRVGNTLYLAGQIALDPRTNQMIADRSIEAETRQVLDNLRAVVEAAGFTMADIVSTTVFMADLNEFARMNAVYATYFPTSPPARATVQAARLPRDVKVEIAAIAAR